MTIDESLEILNWAVTESVMDINNTNLCTEAEDTLISIGLDSLDWSIVFMHMEDRIVIDEETMGELGPMIADNCTVQDMHNFFTANATLR